MVVYALRLRVPLIKLRLPAAEIYLSDPESVKARKEENPEYWFITFGEKLNGKQMGLYSIRDAINRALNIQVEMVQHFFVNVFQKKLATPERDLLHRRVREIFDMIRGACTDLRSISWKKTKWDMTVREMNESVQKTFSNQLAICNHSIRLYSNQFADVRIYFIVCLSVEQAQLYRYDATLRNFLCRMFPCRMY